MKNKDEMWSEYLKINPNATEYDSGVFCGIEPEDTDLLANLVLQRIKTASAGSYEAYLADNIPLPKVGAYSIVLNSRDEPVCITKTTKVFIEKFNKVSAEHAQKEGEGDLSLKYWRMVHEEFITNELKEINKEFSEEVLVVCEEFECVYPIDLESQLT